MQNAGKISGNIAVASNQVQTTLLGEVLQFTETANNRLSLLVSDLRGFNDGLFGQIPQPDGTKTPQPAIPRSAAIISGLEQTHDLIGMLEAEVARFINKI